MRRYNLFLLVLLFYSYSFGAIFNVTNEAEFQIALNTALNNGEDDTIIMSSGIYKLKNRGSTSFKYVNGEGKALIIQGAGIDKTIIDGTGVTGQSLLYITSDSSVTIRNLTFNGGNTTFTDLGGTQNFSGGGLYLVAAKDILIENVKFTRNTVGTGYGGGAFIASYKGEITIRNCIFYKNLALAGAGAYIQPGNSYSTLSAGNLNLYNNVFYENGGYQGAGFYIAPNTIGDIRIINNTVVKNSILPNTSSSTSYGAGGYLFLNANVGTLEIYNNIFWLNENNARTTDKVNDLFINNIAGVPYLYLYNNNIDPNDTDSFALKKSISMDIQKNIYEDPEFEDMSNLNFMPKSYSLMVDKGENNIPISIKKDIAGNPRIQNNVIDIGAYEYQGKNNINNSPNNGEANKDGNNNNNVGISSGGGGGCSLGKKNILSFTYLLIGLLFMIRKIYRR